MGLRCVRFSVKEKEREKMGKGNYGVLATRKPMLKLGLVGEVYQRFDARQSKEPKNQLPPRDTR